MSRYRAAVSIQSCLQNPLILGDELLAIQLSQNSKCTFILLANSFAYSAASSLFFWVRCFFRAIRLRLCCSTRGVTSRWILGAFVLGFLPKNRYVSAEVAEYLLKKPQAPSSKLQSKFNLLLTLFSLLCITATIESSTSWQILQEKWSIITRYSTNNIWS